MYFVDIYMYINETSESNSYEIKLEEFGSTLWLLNYKFIYMILKKKEKTLCDMSS